MKRLLPWLWPFAVAVISLGITAQLWMHERRTEQARLKAGFDFGVRHTASRIEQHLASYEQMLHGARGLFIAESVPDRSSFDTYVDALQSGPGIVGLQAIAYGPFLRPEQLADHVAAQRASGNPGYTVRPPGKRAAFAPITYIAPAIAINLSALGYDPYSEPIRQAAMVRAADSGNAAITNKVRLVTEPDQTPQAGFLMFLPLYDQQQAPTNVLERRAHLAGWVWGGFRMGDLMSSLYGEGTPGLELHIHDGVDLGDASLMYSSHNGSRTEGAKPARFEALEYLAFAGHTWTLHVSSLPEFEQRYSRDASRIIAMTGSGLSLLLALLTHQWVSGRARALSVAQAMTRELRNSEERYRRIVETANEGIWTIDAQSRISYANARMLQMLGYTAGEMMGRPLSDFVARAEHMMAIQPLTTGELIGDAAQPEIQLRRKDGTNLWASLSIKHVTDAGGTPAGALAMVTDITEKQQAEAKRSLLEAQLRASQKMEAIGTLAGGIAHDFNNILAAILGNVALAREHLGTPHAALQSLTQIDQAGVRARGLVQQILAFSRMQPHVLVSQPLRPLVEESIRLLRSTLPALVEFDVNLSDKPLHVSADATQVQQVVMNLCTNAWHALQGGPGRITVTLDEQEIDVAEAQRLNGLQAGRCAHLSVSDTGSGMDTATRERVFEPFYTTKRVGQGTGLGLSVVHGIVTTHHGAIRVDSTPGEGSTFHLYLPLRDPPAEAALAELPPAEAPRGQGQHVLYVDDDPAMLLMVESLLKRAGYQVTAFDNPRHALAAVREQPRGFDLVVTDFNMPELTGMDLAEDVAQINPSLPVVISSGYISDDLRAAALRLGVRHLLQKEYTLEQLTGVVHAALTQAKT